MEMPLSPTWTDIAVRLALTMIAGLLLGFNRGARGHAAGLLGADRFVVGDDEAEGSSNVFRDAPRGGRAGGLSRR